ncbi:MAG: CopD family protein [Thaumarchaeota archaeon]|nr:CopD family protein [Nitrososphaerota archaeon]
MKKILIFVFLISFSVIQTAYAHPLLIDSDPAQSSNVSTGTNKVIIYFSEAVEQSYSYIKVFDNNGEQIDNKDTNYFKDETALIVTTKPLQVGVYTVSTQVLSKVDGHLVPYSFVFGVGDVSLPMREQPQITESIYFPEAGARFPGLVGQVVVLGSVISSLLIWRSIQKKKLIGDDLSSLQKFYHGKFSSVIRVGLFLVFASNILMLVVQTIRLQVPAINVIQTSFGSVWMVRMILTVALLGIWFVFESKSGISHKKQALLLGLSLALIGTTSVIGHGAATEQTIAIIIDYVHNLLASVWIGGVIFFAFVLMPSFSKLDGSKKELLTLTTIPKFSSMILLGLGILIVTGPTLLWFIEDDVVLLSQSPYGFFIIAKIIIGASMIGLGGYNQFRIQKTAEKNLEGENITVHKKLQKSLRVEAILGILLLGSVALLANTSLPSGQFQQTTAQQDDYVFRTIEFTADSMFEVSIDPLASGSNIISVSALDIDGNALSNLEDVKVKVSNPQRNIAPIEVTMKKAGDLTKYEGDLTFGFSGNWNVEVEAIRSQGTNQGMSFSVFVKPRLYQLKTDVVEYAFPINDTAPLYPVFDGKDTLWISDTSKPRLWKFTLSEKEFKSYEFEGKTSVFLKLGEDGRVWFTDTPESKIGYFDPKTEKFRIIPLPFKSIPVSLEMDLDGNVWIALADKHMLLKYEPESEQFQEYKTPTEPSGPIALKRDDEGKIWFAESQGGKLGVIDPRSGEIQEFMPDEPLKEPFTLYMDGDQNLWTSEHTGLSIVKFNPFLKTFEKIPVSDPNALPFGLAEDKYDNVWIAQHIVDNLGVYDPHKDDFVEVAIPSLGTFTQFITADDSGNIWFVEQRGKKLGNVIISEIPSIGTAKEHAPIRIRYSDLMGPFMTAGIVATSLFFVKSVRDKRRLDSLIE